MGARVSSSAGRLLLAGMAVSVWVTTGACGGSSPASPSTSTPAVQVTASLTPSPMMTRAQEGGAAVGARYQIAGELTFRAAAGFSGRITSIDLTIMCSGGEGGHGSVALDLRIAASAPAVYQLTDLIQMTTSQEPQ